MCLKPLAAPPGSSGASTVAGADPDAAEKSKMLLERLRMLETEKSSLVLENETQRQQYEKCLDEIANQVVQALLTQKVRAGKCLIISLMTNS